MLIPAKYLLTPTIAKHLQTIEAAKSIIDSVRIPTEIETNIRRQSILKSSLFSARIEGNPLTLAEVTTSPSKDQKKSEIFNILSAMHALHKRGSRDLTTTFLLELHKRVMSGLIERANVGKFRTEVSAIFNNRVTEEGICRGGGGR